ncbi:hypothetical protein Tco_0265290 [Tanacetum coccineum]
MSEHGTYMSRESSSGQVNEIEPGPSTSVPQEVMDEMSQTVDEAKLCKINDVVWESRKEILVSPYTQRPTSVVQSCQRDPKAPALSLVNQDLLYLKKGSLGPKKIMMSLHKFLAVIFPDDDIEERTSRWLDKCVKKFNPYARYNVKHWKNLHAKIFYINKHREPENPKEIIARRANGSIVSITKSDYKNLNKNDIEDIYLLNVHIKVDGYAETGLLCGKQSTESQSAPTITFPGIEKYKMFSIVSEPVYGIIYKNSKKAKRVMRHQEIHKFCDVMLKRVLEGLKSYNNDVKHGYVTPSLSKEDAEYLQLFEEDIEERLKHRDQMRRCEMYVNRRPLGSRREHP